MIDINKYGYKFKINFWINYCNSKSKEQESLWKKKQDYYNKIADEAESMEVTSPYKDEDMPMQKLVKKESPKRKISKRRRRRSDDIRTGWFSWCLGPRQNKVTEKPFSEQLKSKEWIKNLINSMSKFVKLQEGFNEIINFIKDK